ncbi:MAG: porin [Gemmatimonadales bacterium]
MARPALFALLALLPCAALSAQTPDTTADSTARKLAQLAREVEALRLEVRRHQALLDQRDVAAMQAERTDRQAPDQRYRQISGIASRPFLYRGVNAAVGGYVDLEFAHDFDASTTTFTQHRLIPFIFAEISDRLHFGTEIEIEYGGPQSATDDGEIKVEFAAVDFSITEALNVRAGALLSPLGKFNLIHDSPVNDLTDRPLVDNRIIPTTLTEAGAGLFGRVYPSDGSVLTYEAYVVNGFNHSLVSYAVDAATGAITPGMNVRSARGSLRRDNNTGKSLVGRVAYSPLLGVELGASAHTGGYGDAGDGRLTVAALDAIVARGRWELLGEFAVATVDIDATAELPRARAAFFAAKSDTVGFGAAYAAAAFTTAQRGGYLQFNYHFLQGAVGGFPNSTFTGVVRVDHLDLDADRDGSLEQRLSAGVNWRPLEQSVIKFDYQWHWLTPAGTTTRLPATNRLMASVATYF